MFPLLSTTRRGVRACASLTKITAISAAFSLLTILAHADVVRNEACLNGEWEATFNNSETLPENAVWRIARVPSFWNQYPNKRAPYTDKATWEFPDGAADAQTGWFRLSFPIPDEWAGQQIKLFFEYIGEANVVYLNGQQIHESPYANVSIEIDATAAALPGKTNTLLVKTSTGSMSRSGVGRDVFIRTRPQTAIDYVLIQPSVRNKTLSLQVQLEGGAGENTDFEVIGQVLDGSTPVLTIPAHKVAFTGEDAPTAVSLPWENPILWGFGEYGTPHLYTLKLELLRDGKRVDVKYERFGFREFYAEGDKFMLNGKSIRIKGDLYTKTHPHADHPAAAMAYLQRMRASNMNFLRWHTSPRLDNPIWFNVGDETGFLMQPEMQRPLPVDGKPLPPNDPIIKRMLRRYIIANYNHPSIISWCVDNETFYVGLTATLENQQKMSQRPVAEYDDLMHYVRSVDPTRIIEIHHNYNLWPMVRMKKFSRENFEIFDIHPYGNLLKVINTEQKAVGFKGEVPVLVGEIFPFENPVDFAQDPRGAYSEQWRVGEEYYRKILDASAANHVAGTVLCAESAHGYIGFTDANTFYLGPWDADAKIMDGDKIAALRRFNVFPQWPSLSGVGTKVDYFPGWTHSYGGYFGLNLNWFDPSVPMYHSNLIDDRIRQAYEEVDGHTVPAMPETRIPEIVVALGKEGKPLAHEFVWLQDPTREGERTGVLTDLQGTAWFRLNGIGNYRLLHGSTTKEVSITHLPALTEQPGYAYLIWVDMGGIDIAKQQQALTQPPRKETIVVQKVGEFLDNGDFEDWQESRLGGWPIKPRINDGERSADAFSGKYSLKLAGTNGEAALRIQLEKGQNYRISGAIKKRSGESVGYIRIVGFIDKESKRLLEIHGSGTIGEWQPFSHLYTADGTERYLMVQNDRTEKESVVLYDALSIRKDTSAQPTEKAFEGGPFVLSEKGFIRDWLVLGPFPNRGDELRGYEAAKTDYLQSEGGEATYQPEFGRTVRAKFEKGFYWKTGDYALRWDQLHSEKDVTILDGVTLPESGIVGKPGAPATHVAAYLACVIESPTDREITIGMGSDDGYLLYLNGELIGSYLNNRGSKADQEKWTTRLTKGRNQLLLKAIQESGGWDVWVKLTDQTGQPMTDLKVHLPQIESLLLNGDFSEWTDDNTPAYWRIQPATVGSKETQIVPKEGGVSVRLEGNISEIIQTVHLEPGATYHIEGKVRSAFPRKIAAIGIRDMAYNWLLRLQSHGTMNEWETLSGTLRIPENLNTLYFYCSNWYQRENALSYYSELKLFKIADAQ